MHTKPLGLCLLASLLPLPNAAQGQAPDSLKITELPAIEIVTARRREEAAQDVPASISVLGGELLERERAYQIQELPNYLSGLNANFFHARESALAIRGIGNNAANEGLQGSVGLSLDNVYLGRPGQLAIDLLDIEQIDLLKGPQGTLFGKNTTAGVLHITTRRPVFERQAQIETSLGNRGYQQIKAMLNSPLDEHTALRISAYGTHDDGWLTNRMDGKQLDEINRQGLRLQMLTKPDSDTSLRAILEHHTENSSTGTLVPYAYGPWNRGAAAGNLPFGSPGSNATTYGARAGLLGSIAPAVAAPYRYEVFLDGQQRARSHQSAATLELNHKIGGYQLTSITAWRDWHFSPDNDMDNTSLYSVNGGTRTDERQFSQELRLASPLSETFETLIGGYYLNQRTTGQNRFTTGPYALAINSIPNNAVLAGRGSMRLNSLAAFGQATVHLTERLDLTAGLRLNHETHRAQVSQDAANPAFPVSPLFMRYESGPMHATENALSSQMGSSYRLSDTVMAYLSHARSEKSGGYNLNGVLSPGALLGTAALRVKPEKARNIEVGLKSTWLAQRLTLNATAFRTQVSDYQAVTNTDWQNTYVSYLTNVGDITARGIETEGRWRANERLDLRLSITYLDARFDRGSAPTPAEEFNGPGGTATSGYGQGSRSLAGKQVNGAPHWTANLSGHTQWNLPGHNLTQYLNASYAWRSASYGDINNSIYARLPAYGLFNLATGWRGRAGGHGWDFSLWAKNLLDKHYYQALIAAQNAYFGAAGQPRTLGATLKIDF